MDTSLVGIVSGFHDASMDRRLWPAILRRMGDAVHPRSGAGATRVVRAPSRMRETSFSKTDSYQLKNKESREGVEHAN